MTTRKTAEDKRKKIGLDMLHRYTGTAPRKFYKNIILTNFSRYMDAFSEQCTTWRTSGSVMHAAHCDELRISMIDFRVGSPTAALVIDMLSNISPRAVIFLGMTGGIHRRNKVGDFILPIAAIRGDGVSQHYMPPQVPSMPTFKVQKFISQVLVEHKLPYLTGVVHTTDYRFWEFDNKFIANLKKEKALCIDMECASLFTAALAKKVPIGALLLVSDTPFEDEGVKTKKKADRVFRKFSTLHVQLGVEVMRDIKARGENVNMRHFEW